MHALPAHRVATVIHAQCRGTCTRARILPLGPNPRSSTPRDVQLGSRPTPYSLLLFYRDLRRRAPSHAPGLHRSDNPRRIIRVGSAVPHITCASHILSRTNIGGAASRTQFGASRKHTHPYGIPTPSAYPHSSICHGDVTSAVQTDGRHTAIVRRAMHTGLAYHMVCHRPPAPSGQAPANGWLVPHSTDEAAITPTPSSSNPPRIATARPATSGHRGGGIA